MISLPAVESRLNVCPLVIVTSDTDDLILNISSLQLVPVSVIAYRSQYGSIDPAVITGPAIAATAVSTGAGILFCLFMNRKQVFRKKSK